MATLASHKKAKSQVVRAALSAENWVKMGPSDANYYRSNPVLSLFCGTFSALASLPARYSRREQWKHGYCTLSLRARAFGTVS